MFWAENTDEFFYTDPLLCTLHGAELVNGNCHRCNIERILEASLKKKLERVLQVSERDRNSRSLHGLE